MKAITIQQPWATLVCAGIKDVENRDWAIKNLPMRILIHAGASPRNMRQWPACWGLPLDLAQDMGIIGDLKDFPKSAIIGAVTIDRCDEENDSIWAQPESKFHWVIKDPVLFKQPITGVKGKLSLFEVPGIDENNLPEAVEIPKITREGTHITVPLGQEIYEEITDPDSEVTAVVLSLLDGYNFEQLATLDDEDWPQPLPTETVTFTCGDRSKEFEVAQLELEPEVEEDDTIVTYEDPKGKWREMWNAVIVVKK